jgi:hypothetical protein
MVMMTGSFGATLLALADPVQRRWLVGRLANRWPADDTAYRPTYLDVLPKDESPRAAFGELAVGPPPSKLTLSLPGQTLAFGPGQAKDVVRRHFDDPAAAAAFHAFSWLGRDGGEAALAALWPAWLERHGQPDSGSPAWHPAVAAERVVALLDLASHAGLPPPRRPTLAALAHHASFLVRQIEDFDEEEWPSDLLHRAWALVRLGLDLAMPATAAFGLSVVIEEAGRLVLPSGMSNVQSIQHHLLVCRSVADTWLAARRRYRPEAGRLAAIIGRLLGVVPLLALPGGLPLVGDVAETLPPGWLDGLCRGGDMTRGWTGRLSADERLALAGQRDADALSDLEALRSDGWLRLDMRGWSGLWHAAPGGWARPVAHGHQDFGSCELHFESVPIFIDPGGGPLDALNGGSLCRRAAVHGGLQLDGFAPYPEDRPYYTEAFRRRLSGPSPVLRTEFDGVSLAFAGFSRLGGPREARRRWRFTEGGFTLDDLVNGTGRYGISRRFITPLAVTVENPVTALLEGRAKRFRLNADSPLIVGEGVRWTGYGRTEPVRFIEISARRNLPWRGSIRVEPA